jgi:hypothetical protein
MDEEVAAMRPSIASSHRAFLLTVAILLAATAAPARAELPIDAVPQRPIRMVGYWERDRGAPKVLEAIRIVSTEGGPPRLFGITALQAYKPEEEGPQVLRHSGPRATLRVLGAKAVVDRLLNAPATERVTIYGVYNPGTDTITLNSVEIG